MMCFCIAAVTFCKAFAYSTVASSLHQIREKLQDRHEGVRAEVGGTIRLNNDHTHTLSKAPRLTIWKCEERTFFLLLSNCSFEHLLRSERAFTWLTFYMFD